MSDMRTNGRAIFRGIKKTIEDLQSASPGGSAQPKNIKVVQLLSTITIDPRTEKPRDGNLFMLEKVRIDNAGQIWLQGWYGNDVMALGYAHGQVRFEQVKVDVTNHQPVIFEEDPSTGSTM